MRRVSGIKLNPRERKAINAFSRRLRRALGKELVSVVLFGSKARGDFSRSSDIDIYILVKQRRRKVDDKIATITAEILDEYDILLSPVSYDVREEQKNLDLRSFFFEAVKKEGVPI